MTRLKEASRMVRSASGFVKLIPLGTALFLQHLATGKDDRDLVDMPSPVI